MSAPTIDQQQWLLEFSANPGGSGAQFTAVSGDGAPIAVACEDPIAAIVLDGRPGWKIMILTGAARGLKHLEFVERDDALNWLAHLADLHTRPVTA